MENFDKFIREEYSKYDKLLDVNREDPEFNKHFRKWCFSHSKIDLNETGQLFLYEIYDHDSKTVSYPKIGVLLDFIPCDQTIEIEWIDKRRTWEYNRKYKYNFKDGGYHNEEREYDFLYLSSAHRMRSLPQWNDYHLVYGVWDKLPDWKTLRRHYENTWWFHRTIDEKRDIDIERLLGHLE